VAATLPLFLLGVGDRSIWIPLEARYALVAREMLQGGHWLLPHLGGHVYPDKPPLFFWAIALISALGSGVSEWTARLPTAIAAVGVCLLTYGMGTRLFTPAAGVAAALVLATSAGFFWSGRQALPDMLLTLWTTGAWWAWWEWMVAERWRAAPLAGLCMGLATLTKGPVGLLLPTLTAAAFSLVQKERRWLRWRELGWCGGAYLVVTLAWYLPAVGQGGLAYAEATLLHHSLERYVRAWEHTAPWYFYLGAFPAEFLPWTLFLPQALWHCGRQPRGQAGAGWWFAACWLATVVVFFSLSSGKRDIYILPAFPAAALLVGALWSRWWERPAERRPAWTQSWPLWALALGLWALAAAIWAAVGGVLPTKSTLLLPTTPAGRLWTGVLLTLGGGLLGGVALGPHRRAWFGAVVGCTWWAMLLAVTCIYTPQFNQRYPIKAFAAAVHAQVAPDQPLALCGPLNDLALRFNLGRGLPVLPDVAAARRYLDSDGRVVCVIDELHYRGLPAFPWPLPVLARAEIDGRVWLLVANRP
jgi:4-amino-4-deoxy-L-arabinose transferase-like glycosyltransferase